MESFSKKKKKKKKDILKNESESRLWEWSCVMLSGGHLVTPSEVPISFIEGR